MAFNPKPHLPQYSFFQASYQIPGTNWTITGHSRALERTGFWIPELRVVLDAGIDLPTGSGARPLAVMVTHGHIDHCNALPMLLRHQEKSSDPPVEIFCPGNIIHRLRSYVQMSWAVRVNIEDTLPDAYSAPPESDRRPQAGDVLDGDLPYRRWRACEAGTRADIVVGKKMKSSLVVYGLQLFHGRCSSVGYLLSEPAQTCKKVRPGLVGANKKETGDNVRAARSRGEDFQITVQIPERPRFAFCLDTMIEVLVDAESQTACQVLECPVIMIECTYLEQAMREEARKRGHISWSELLPFVATSVRKRKATHGDFSQTWMLVHFSLRYTDEHIANFFHDLDQCKLLLEQKSERPPDLVLWLDTGPRELWVGEFTQ
mmetsp:Transcript_7838/g.11456  ORF Transcript_7838/g.11456 Transcript_7838/m.11456 type:complete len:374 (-) Transcript_7838:4-1125(-)